MKRPGLLKKSSKVFSIFYQRFHTRKALAQLDDRLLKDIGLSRTDQYNEIRKPFWR
ncbi:MAG: DUF1127 domain-containing protein [Proteobacteria bacterium]|nr:DUF1127 domain-containing protein [Pseudomonadota bacterium]